MVELTAVLSLALCTLVGPGGLQFTRRLKPVTRRSRKPYTYVFTIKASVRRILCLGSQRKGENQEAVVRQIVAPGLRVDAEELKDLRTLALSQRGSEGSRASVRSEGVSCHWTSLALSIHLSMHPSMHPCMHACMHACMPARLHACKRASICVLFHPSICLPIYPSIYLPIYISIHHVYVHLL